MKVVERVVDRLIREQVYMDCMLFGVMWVVVLLMLFL